MSRFILRHFHVFIFNLLLAVTFSGQANKNCGKNLCRRVLFISGEIFVVYASSSSENESSSGSALLAGRASTDRLSLYGSGAFAHDLFQLVVSGLEIFWASPEVPELLEFGLHATKNTPHLAAAFLDGQRGIPFVGYFNQYRSQCGRPRDNHVVFL